MPCDFLPVWYPRVLNSAKADGVASGLYNLEESGYAEGVQALMAAPHDLSPIEKLHWRSQQSLVPPGPLVSGPYRHPPYWRCFCGVSWSNGTHPHFVEPAESEEDQT